MQKTTHVDLSEVVIQYFADHRALPAYVANMNTAQIRELIDAVDGGRWPLLIELLQAHLGE